MNGTEISDKQLCQKCNTLFIEIGPELSKKRKLYTGNIVLNVNAE